MPMTSIKKDSTEVDPRSDSVGIETIVFSHCLCQLMQNSTTWGYRCATIMAATQSQTSSAFASEDIPFSIGLNYSQAIVRSHLVFAL